MPETGEEIFSSFLGVPIQRLGEMMGVLVVQNQRARDYTEDEVYALEVVAMVLAEMAELGAFVGEGAAMAAPHQNPLYLRGVVGQEGSAEGHVHLHDPQIVIANPVADDPAVELERLRNAMDTLRADVRKLLKFDGIEGTGEHIEVMKAYQMFANDKGWMRRMEHSIQSGLAAEVAVEREQSATRARMERVPDAYLRERLHDLDDLANKLLRLLVNRDDGTEVPKDAILVARNIGPGELLEYGTSLKGVVLEEGSVGSHASIVARALAIPLVIQADRITREALNGDHILVDGNQAAVHLRPDESVTKAFREKLAMQADAQEAYAALRDKPARTKDGVDVTMLMNAGLLADLPSLTNSGAQGVALFGHHGRCQRHARHLPHARYRVGQSPALYEENRRTEPCFGLARHPPRPGPARGHAIPTASDDPRRQGSPLARDVPICRPIRRIHIGARTPARSGRKRACTRKPCARKARNRRDAGNPKPRLRPRPLL